MRRVVVQWSRFGPYHLARLRGAMEEGARRGLEVVGLEVASRDQYAWEPASPAGEAGRRTLFPGRDYGDLPPSGIRAAVRSALEDLAPDAVAVNGWSVPEARAALAWCGRRRGRGAVVMSETKADDAARRWWKEWGKRRILRTCGAALVGGRPQADYVRSLGVPRERVFLGYDAVDNRHFAEGAARARASAAAERARLGLPERYFFACTRFLARKNVDGLLRAYAEYRKAAPDPWSLVVAGSGEEEAALRRLAAELGLAEVKWAGFLQYPDLPAHFGLAGAFIHPARSEPWGLVVNEAAACGLPLLVARPVGAAYELVEDGANGFLFDPLSVEDLARRLGDLAGLDGGARAAMGERSAVIASRWSPARFGEGLASAVEAACGGAA